MSLLLKMVMRTVVGLLAMAGVLLTLVVVILLLRVPLDFGFAAGDIEAVASRALGRQVIIEGPIRLTPSLWPVVDISGLRIGNPPGWANEAFAQLPRLRAEIGLIPMLSGQIRFRRIAVAGLRLQMVRQPSGEANWQFLGSSAGTATPGGDQVSMGAGLFEIQRLSVEDAVLIWHDARSDQLWEVALERVTGEAPSGRALQLTAAGRVQQQPFSMSLKGDPVAGLLPPRQPWAFQLQAKVGTIDLDLGGTLQGGKAEAGVGLKASLRGERIADLAAMAGADLALMGAFSLDADLSVTGTGVEVRAVEGDLAGNRFSGAGTMDFSGPRPWLTGSLDMARLDSDWLAAAARSRQQEPAGDAGGLQPDALNILDAQLQLKVRELVNAPLRIRDASTDLSLNQGRLSAPFSVELSGIPVTGRLALTGDGEAFKFDLGLTAAEAPVAQLAEALTGDRSVSGFIGHFGLEASGEGGDIGALVQGLDLQIRLHSVDLAQTREDGRPPVRLALENLDVTLEQGRETRLSAAGSLLGQPFTVSLPGGGLSEWIEGDPWPVQGAANGAGAQARAEGYLRLPTAGTGPRLEVELSGERLGLLNAWTGVRPGSRLSYALRGRLDITGAGWSLDGLQARLGQTRVSGSLKGSTSDDAPLIEAVLRFTTLHLPELQSLRVVEEKRPIGGKVGLVIDLPVLPQRVVIDDADLDLSVGRLVLPRTDVHDLRLKMRVRDGYVKRSPVAATVGGARFDGHAMLDLRGQVPSSELKLTAREVDVGQLLRHLGIVDDLEATARVLQADLRLEGRSLRSMARHSEVQVTVEDGRWTLRDPKLQTGARVQVDKGTARARPGQPLRVELKGRIDETPITIAMESEPLAALIQDGVRLPLNIEARAAGADLRLSAAVQLPFDQRDMDFRLSVSGTRLDDLDALLLLSLPPWGPHQARGRFQVLPDGYHLSELDLRVGASRLGGRAQLSTNAARPRLDVALASETIQLDDFELGDWSITGVADGDPNVGTQDPSDIRGPAAVEGLRTILSPEVMRGMDADLAVEVEEVVSGGDHLGKGTLKAILRNGRLEIDPFELQVAGGDWRLALALDRSGPGVGASLTAFIDRFDYGIPARRIDPQTEVAGLFSLDVDLDSRGDTIADLAKHVSGKLDFALWPENLRGDVFDIWAVNLLVAILPTFDQGSGAKVNCVIGQLDLDDGLMRTKSLILDTTRVRVIGSGTVDFRTEEVDLVLQPTPKRPQFYSLATPLVVDGTFSDFGVGATPADLIGTVLRLYYTYLVVPFELLTRGVIPADGADVCSALPDRSRKASEPTEPEPTPTEKPSNVFLPDFDT